MNNVFTPTPLTHKYLAMSFAATLAICAFLAVQAGHSPAPAGQSGALAAKSSGEAEAPEVTLSTQVDGVLACGEVFARGRDLPQRFACVSGDSAQHVL